MAINTTFSTGAVLTAAQMNNLPWGIAGKSTLALNKAYTTIVDSGLTVTWTANSTRQYKLSFYGNIDQTAAATVQFFITDSAGVAIGEIAEKFSAASFQGITSFALLTGVTGSQTYKVRMQCSAGTGTLFGQDTRTALAAVFVVEDIGAA